MTIRTALTFSALLFALGGTALHPFGPVKQDSRPAPLLSGSAINQTGLEWLQRSCANCHSDHVDWPWYGHVAPVSWLLEKDVREARQHLNLSRWSDYTPQEQITLLSAMGAVLRTNTMPPQRYLALHPHAALSELERNALYEWAKTERRRLRTLPPQELDPKTTGDNSREQ
jgi:hypothetical protein